MITFISFGGHPVAARIVLSKQQRQGPFESSALDVPPAADTALLRVTGLSQAQLADPNTVLTFGIDRTNSGGDWINLINDSVQGSPDRIPKPPATEYPDFLISVELVNGPTRPSKVRGWIDTPGYLSYSLELDFQAAGESV